GQVQYNSSGSFGGAAFTAVATSGTLLTLTAGAITDIPLVIAAASGQTASLVEFRANDGSVIGAFKRVLTVDGPPGLQVGKNADQAGAGFVEIGPNGLHFNRSTSNNYIDTVNSTPIVFRAGGSYTTIMTLDGGGTLTQTPQASGTAKAYVIKAH